MTDESGVAPLQAAEAAPVDVLEQIRRLHEALKSHERTVVCAPEAEDAVRQSLAQHDWFGLFKVQASGVVPEGSVVFINEHAIEANMREVLRDGVVPRPASYWQADYRAIVEDTWRGKFRDGPPDAAQPPSSEASPK